MAFKHYILVCGGTYESSKADAIYQNLIKSAK